MSKSSNKMGKPIKRNTGRSDSKKPDIKYPGLGYTLFVKSFPNDATNVNPWFECILCAPNEKMIPKKMSSHLKSYSHVWNVLMLESPTSSNQFEKGDETKLHEITEFLKTDKSDVMVAANLSNVGTKREEILDQLKSIRLKAEHNEEELTMLKSDAEYREEENTMLKSHAEHREEENTKLKSHPEHKEEEENTYDDKSALNDTKPSNDDNFLFVEDLIGDEYTGVDYTLSPESNRVNNEKFICIGSKLKFSDDSVSDSFGEDFNDISKASQLQELIEYDIFDKGSKAKLYFLNQFEALQRRNETVLRFVPRHPFYYPLKGSYLGTPSFISTKHFGDIQRDFLMTSMNYISIHNNILLYDNKYILPDNFAEGVAKYYHEGLHHAQASTIYDILCKEFHILKHVDLQTIQLWIDDCEKCKMIPSEVQKACSDVVMKSYNCWPNRRSLKTLLINNLVCTASTRKPKNIVILGDERDDFLKDLEVPAKVTVRICAGLTLENAFDFITCDPSFDQEGVLYVVLAGALSALRWENDPACNNCTQPALVPNLIKMHYDDVFSYMLNSGRNLLQSVLLNSATDLVIFAHMLPFDLSTIAFHLLQTHNNGKPHPSNHSMHGQWSKECTLILSAVFKEYNTFTDTWSESLGIPAWNLSEGFYETGYVKNIKRKDCPVIKKGNFMIDGINYSPKIAERRMEQIQACCKRTLEKLETPQQICELSSNLSSLMDPISVGHRNKPVRKFEKILIFCEPENKRQLQEFGNSNVLITDTVVNAASIEHLAETLHLKDCNSLWIFTSGVKPIANKENFNDCANCATVLPFLTPKEMYCTKKAILVNEINSVMDGAREVIKSTENIVGPNCVAVVLPIIPLVVANEASIHHERLHELLSLHNHIFICNNHSIDKLLPLYAKLVDKSLELSMKLFKAKGLYPMALENYSPRYRNVFRSVGLKQHHIPLLPMQYEQMVRNIIYSALTGYPVVGHVTPEVISKNIHSNLFEFKGHINRDDFHFKNIVLVSNKWFSIECKGFDVPFIHKVQIPLDSSEENIQERVKQMVNCHKETAWIYLIGHELIADKKNFNDCNFCMETGESLPSYFCLKNFNSNNHTYYEMNTFDMVKSCIMSAQKMAASLQQNLHESSCVVVMPFCRTSGLITNESNVHKLLHNYPHVPKIQEFFVGDNTTWMDAQLALELFFPFLMESVNINIPYVKDLTALSATIKGKLIFLLNAMEEPLLHYDVISKWSFAFNELCSTVLNIKKDCFDSCLGIYPDEPPVSFRQIKSDEVSTSANTSNEGQSPKMKPPMNSGISSFMNVETHQVGSSHQNQWGSATQSNMQRPPPMGQGPPRMNQGPPRMNQGPPAMGPPPMGSGPPAMGPPPMGSGPPSMGHGTPPMGPGPPFMGHGPHPMGPGPPSMGHGPYPMGRGPPPIGQGPPPMNPGRPPHMMPGPPHQMQHGFPPHPRPGFPPPFMGRGQPRMGPGFASPMMAGQPPFVRGGPPPFVPPHQKSTEPPLLPPGVAPPQVHTAPPPTNATNMFPPPTNATNMFPPPNTGTNVMVPPPINPQAVSSSFVRNVAPPNFSLPTTSAPPIFSLPTTSAPPPKFSLSTTISAAPVKYGINSKTVQPKPTEFRVLVGKIPLSMTDAYLSSILTLIGNFLSFERPKVENVSYGVAKFLLEEAAERAVRVLDNFPVMGGIIEVRLLYYTDKKMTKKLGITIQLQDDSTRKAINDQVKLLLQNFKTETTTKTGDTVKVVSKPEVDGKEKPITISIKTKSLDKAEQLEDISDDELTTNIAKKQTGLPERNSSDKLSKETKVPYYSSRKPADRGKKSFYSSCRSRDRSYSRSRSRSRSRSSSSDSSPVRRSSSSTRGYGNYRGRYFRGRGAYRQDYSRLPKAPPTNRPWSPFDGDRHKRRVFSPPKVLPEVKIYNYSRIFKATLLDELVMACGSPTPCKKRGTFFLVNFPSMKRAYMVTQHLNNKRLVDKTLKVEVLGKTKDIEEKITVVEDSAVAKEIERVYEEHKLTLVAKLQGDILKDPDIFTFHIFPCEVINCRAYDCHYYHGLSDKRRDYLKYKYTEKMCPYICDGRPCPQEDWCIHCHSQVERLYHPKSYKSNVCLDWYEEEKCPNQLFCTKAHPLSNDSFFTEAWKDVFVAGLDQGFFFFSGALKMFYKVVDSEGGVPIIFLSPLVDICHLLLNIVKPVSRIHRLKASVITETELDPAGADVLLSTPSALATLIKNKGSAPLGGVRVLVFDDITTLINSPVHATDLHTIIEAIYKEVPYKSAICKVAVSETCHPSEIEDANCMLKSKFQLYNPYNIDQAMPPSVSHKNGSARPQIVLSSDSEEEKRLSRKGVASTSKKPRRHYSTSPSSSSSSSGSSSPVAPKSKRRRRYSGSSTHSEDSNKKLSPEESAKMKSLEKEGNADIEESFSVYLEVPEMHPEYEVRYDKFLKSYKKKYGTSDESEHLDRMWHKYWKICIMNLKTTEMKKKREDILKQIKSEKKLQPASASGSTKTPAKNSIADSVSFLENISENIEGVGNSLHSLLSALKLYGLQSSRAIHLLTKEDSINIMHAASTQLSQMIAEESDLKRKDDYTSALSCTFQLFKYAQSQSDSAKKAETTNTTDVGNPSVRFDIDVFARQTLGQEDSWIYATLEKSLEYAYGSKPALDKQKQMFMDVKKLHHTMIEGTDMLSASSLLHGTSATPRPVVQNISATPRPMSKPLTIPLTPLIRHMGSRISGNFPVDTGSSVQSKRAERQ